MGLFMLYTVYNSKYRNLLRIDSKVIMKWIGFMAVITVYRIIVFKIFSDNSKLHDMTSGAMMIPWQATLTVFWEDACHGLPLAILSIWLGQDKLWKKIFTWSAVALVAISFGLGHVYQGYISAFFLSFYIPYTFKKGQQVGFGTIMICHTIYDLLTITTMKTFLG